MVFEYRAPYRENGWLSAAAYAGGAALAVAAETWLFKQPGFAHTTIDFATDALIRAGGLLSFATGIGGPTAISIHHMEDDPYPSRLRTWGRRALYFVGGAATAIGGTILTDTVIPIYSNPVYIHS